MKHRVAGIIIIALTVLLIALCGLGAVIMLGWNVVVHNLCHGPAMGFWTGFLIALVFSLLFGGFKLRINFQYPE